MRHIPDDLAARIESGAARLCHVWLMRRVRVGRAGSCSVPSSSPCRSAVFRAASGWTAGAGESAVGLAAGSVSAAGVLDDAAITEADVAAGLLDAATVELWRLDWMWPDLKVRLWAGALVRIRREGDGFVAELEGSLAKLERVVGRTYGRLCDARLGDERCGVAAVAGRTCDKRWGTCVGTFGNGVNFRGFPDVPGDDFLTAYPAQGGRHDGGSRR